MNADANHTSVLKRATRMPSRANLCPLLLRAVVLCVLPAVGCQPFAPQQTTTPLGMPAAPVVGPGGTPAPFPPATTRTDANGQPTPQSAGATFGGAPVGQTPPASAPTNPATTPDGDRMIIRGQSPGVPPTYPPAGGQTYAPNGQGQLPPSAYPPPPSAGVLPTIPTENLGVPSTPENLLAPTPITRTADIYVNGYPARTGRLMFGGAVNSDAGVTGQITAEERNFDITRFPRSFQDLFNGTAFRGAGQTFRLEAVPGSVFKRYTVAFSDPFLFGYLPISTSISGFLFDRRYEDWDEERLGGRLSFGYRVTPDLSVSAGIRMEQVKVTDPRVTTVPELNAVLGDNDMYSWQARLVHDTRNNPFAPSEGHYFETTFEQAFGDFDFNRYELSYNRYFLVRERADRSGRQTLTMGFKTGISGEDTPVFENYFAGGYTTMRGFEFRGASPTVQGVKIGGRFQFLGTFEYLFPLTADDMLRGVAFVDYGTVERDVEMNRENFRVAPGVGLRVAVPALGPAPLAFDFAFPVAEAAGDEKQSFSFFMGYSRRF